MSSFARPAGIANPDTLAAGYRGTQFGIAGSRNLYQIGGGLNTLGVPAGQDAGTDFDVRQHLNVGQSAPQVIATGTLNVPCVLGTYSYSLDAVIANVLETVVEPPAISTAATANISISSSTITFIVTSVMNCPADFNRDCLVSVQDIFDFLSAYFTNDPRADINLDGTVSVQDILDFVMLYFAGCV